MVKRHPSGSFIAEHVAVIVVLFLAITFPLINLATSTYRYNMVCSAAKVAAHAGANATTFTGAQQVGQTDSGPGVNVAVPAAVHHYLDNANGITNVNVNYRINQSDISSQATTNNAWQQKLASKADTTQYIYTIEVVVDADVAPLYPMNIPLIPSVPGLTAATHQMAAAQEMSEFPNGLDK